jgi:broad specificity phosphatase PhoE
LVRHAEKLDDSADPPLTEAGRARADVLRRILADAGVSAVYSTDFLRTRGTAAPLAEARNLSLSIYDADRAVDEVRAIVERHRGETVLVVGHSPSIPAMVNALVPGAPLTKLKRYDGLFILVLPAKSPPKLLRLHYGAEH